MTLTPHSSWVIAASAGERKCPAKLPTLRLPPSCVKDNHSAADQ